MAITVLGIDLGKKQLQRCGPPMKPAANCVSAPAILRDHRGGRRKVYLTATLLTDFNQI